jgi:steroid 5-alpha reductase family enzyme
MNSDLYLMFAILSGLALVLSAIGFYRFIYFISVGYGFSISGMAFFILVYARHNLTLAVILHAILLILYGLRLSIFLLKREFKQTYRKEMDATQKETDPIGGYGKLGAWISVSILYVLMISPLVFHTLSVTPNGLFPFLGVVIMGFGLVIEGLADIQKSAFKAHAPKSFCNVGLFRWSRCPNYFGEITFWFGNFICGLLIYRGVFSWVFAIAGFIGIVFIMLVSTIRLELKQNKRYGDDSAFQEYCASVPILIPFVPIYTLKN